MATITTPVKGFNGKVVGVVFTDGVGETKDEAALAYFGRQGYTIEEGAAEAVVIPEGEPSLEWTAAQLKAYAVSKDIDLGDAKNKPDVLAKLVVVPAE
ncbi:MULTISPECIES: hypothetical protein [Cryobacterium]|uniref:Phage tail protein n=1 Tax=Cryobacterium breve TaxID=1259258 RepID=A0ABY2J4N9_9MICO|nr:MULTISPECIES: hypothetical protein [Cryobacterium]TFC92046.1 hypothetical protein E3T20_12085 [Cryobacterium sp. TmT3-12]TFC99815.1 hypothetical protein E3O65_05420 [Cryobacterium breve]